jgi:hypothetical protein
LSPSPCSRSRTRTTGISSTNGSDDVVERATSLFLAQPQDGWRGREDRILGRNAFADFGISIYCGLVAIWMVERDDGSYWHADSCTARFQVAAGLHKLRQVRRVRRL